MNFVEEDRTPEVPAERDHLALGEGRELADAAAAPQRVRPAALDGGRTQH